MNNTYMKNKIVFFLAVIVSFFTINVNAEELNTLYPIDSVISIQTKNFSYSGMKFNSGVKDRNGYPVISFGSITNNSKSTKPIPISIDILMFDSSQKNIGFITYCSEKDLDTDYSGAVIRQNESLPFNLSIVKKYFVKEKSYSDVAYFSVLDDNEYCKVGAYDKYEGLTYEEIKNGITKTEKSPADKINDLIFSLGAGVGFIGVFIFILLFVYIIYGVILNALYKRMYAEKTVLAYLPFTNVYITIKLAFGSMIAKIYMILYFLSFGLVFLHLEILTAILSLVSGVAFILVIIKLITGKYDLLYFEPSVNNTNNNVGLNEYNNYSNNVNNNVITDYTPDTSNSILDLSYSNNTTNSSNISSNITIGSSNSIGIGDINSNIDANNNYNQNNTFNINSNNGFNQNNFSSNNMNSMFNNKSNENSSNNMFDSNSANSLNNMFNNKSNENSSNNMFNSNSTNSLNNMFNNKSNENSNNNMFDSNSINSLNNMFNNKSNENSLNNMFNNKSNENSNNNMFDSNSANSLNNMFNYNSVNNNNFNTNKNTNNNTGSSSSLFNSSSNNNFNMNSNFTSNLTDELYNDINKSDDDSDNNME